MRAHMSRRQFLRRAALAAPLFAAGGSVAAGAAVPQISFLRDQVDFRPRDEWTDSAPRLWRLRRANGFGRLTVHHSAAAGHGHARVGEVLQELDGVLTSHRNRNYGDIGYHFVIDGAGRVWEGRSLQYEGAHVSGENEANIGVMLLGNFETGTASGAQLGTMHALIVALCRHFGFGPRRVYGHRDLGASACPGRYLYPHVVHLREGLGL